MKTKLGNHEIRVLSEHKVSLDDEDTILVYPGDLIGDIEISQLKSGQIAIRLKAPDHEPNEEDGDQ